MSKKIVAIWAEDDSGLIGANQRMPWYLPSELQHFKETTIGHVILMGRVTFDGMKRRLLPDREVIILTRDETFQDERVHVMHSVEEVLSWFEQQDKDLFICGGAGVYRAFAPYCQRIVQTKVHGHFEGDTYFPSDVFDWNNFECISEKKVTDDKTHYSIRIFDKIER